MALTNGDGVNVDVELAAPYTLGTSHSYQYQEASFYGNIFVDPPQAFYCVGKDYAQTGISVTLLEQRLRKGYNDKQGGVCPYVRVGYCTSVVSLSLGLDVNVADSTILGDKKCEFGSVFSKSDTASACKSGTGFASKTWNYPITTFRKVKQ